MTPETWKRIKDVFQSLVEYAPGERAGRLDQICAGDAELRRELELLLESDEQAQTFLERGVMEGQDAHTANITDDTELAQQAEAATGMMIGHHRIIRKLGEGGMGIVYEAEQQNPRRLVALKVIRGGRFVSEEHIKLFQREAQALARLRHPSIATIYETGRTDDGQHFFAMELVRGVSLSDYMKRDRQGIGNRVVQRLKLFIRLCDAL